jgi:sec-independent protein translocase protein TatC
VWLWHAWRFVTPGLKARERRYALPFVLGSLLFFFGGVVVAYVVFRRTIEFLVTIGGNSLTTYYNPNQYLTLFLLMMLLFGITFEFPVVLVALELARVVSPAQLLRSWRYSVIAIVIFSGLITPSSDPFSMFALMLPLVLFYFLAIALGKLLHR